MAVISKRCYHEGQVNKGDSAIEHWRNPQSESFNSLHVVELIISVHAGPALT